MWDTGCGSGALCPASMTDRRTLHRDEQALECDESRCLTAGEPGRSASTTAGFRCPATTPECERTCAQLRIEGVEMLDNEPDSNQQSTPEQPAAEPAPRAPRRRRAASRPAGPPSSAPEAPPIEHAAAEPLAAPAEPELSAPASPAAADEPSAAAEPAAPPAPVKRTARKRAAATEATE